MGATHKRPRQRAESLPRPDRSEFWKKYWAQPGIREKRRANPKRYTRVGIPDGLDREYADLLWWEAGVFADKYMTEFEEAGVVRPDDQILPESDEAAGKAALREAVKIALGPVPLQHKLSAINIVLQYTKQKPISKVEASLKTPEEWLKGAISAASKKPDERSGNPLPKTSD